MKKLLLIDGSSMLASSFFGNVPFEYMKTGDTKNLMKTSSGVFTNGAYTMTKTLLNLIEKQKPTHMAIAWDVNRNTFRKEMYKEYKAHREETRPELGSQFGVMQDIIAAMNIPQFKLNGFEADDIIGTLAKHFEEDIPVYILTKDQDALQLISEKIKVWLVTSKAKEMYKERGIEIKNFQIPEGVFEYTPITFKEEYGLRPIQMIDKKAIEGDKSDNIPGVKGVGEKAVVPLLQEYGSLEAIYEVIENTEESEMKEIFKTLGIKKSPITNLLENKDIAFLSKELATIKIDMEAYALLKLEDVEVHFDAKSAKEKYAELEFKSLLEKLEKTG